jgi:hypothetical protein
VHLRHLAISRCSSAHAPPRTSAGRQGVLDTIPHWLVGCPKICLSGRMAGAHAGKSTGHAVDFPEARPLWPVAATPSCRRAGGKRRGAAALYIFFENTTVTSGRIEGNDNNIASEPASLFRSFGRPPSQASGTSDTKLLERDAWSLWR